MPHPEPGYDSPKSDPDSIRPGGSGESIDSGKGRIFPCDECGADLEFSIGTQTLTCPFCGALKSIEPPKEKPVVEHDFQAMLEELERLRLEGHVDDETAASEHAIRCNSCGAEVVFQGTLTSSQCPYCACPLQRDKIHDAPRRIPVDGVLPFQIAEPDAAGRLRYWVGSLWFAPNEFLRQGASGKFNGVYLPYFTFDALTWTQYSGRRGDHYTETVGEGDNRRQETRTRWSHRAGEFERFFDDLLIVAAADQSRWLIENLEPWPLQNCVPFTQHYLAGLFARTYDVPLKDAFRTARERMEAALTSDVRYRIGGDEQRIDSQQTSYSQITFKHLLLPVWLLAYRYKEKSYRVAINAVTGEVTGERPYSAIKIACAVLLAIAAAFGIWWLTQSK